ncbi:MAG: hydantoinase B/oxoprolinase family protein [Dehalococcoidia bacterium]|nr:hydantoinase B/oxoprolinase family protein [Dehalococcoidia bacterium]
MVTLDPVTFEVIRHKLWAIGDEQEITLKSVSGSPVVTESSDFNNGIYSSNGDVLMLGRQVIIHAGTMGAVLKSVIEDCKSDPGIDDGDMFIMNDPYRGAVHVQDISLLAPIFYKGDLIAWFGACAHQLDVGGMEPGSLCPAARERVQEGLNIPPLKLVEKGKTRKDVLNMILSNSRLPFLLGLDIRAMIAANNVAKRRFLSLIQTYGLPEVQSVLDHLLDASEKRLRQRLLELPDGTFRAVDFLDHDGHENRLYKVAVAVIKEGDSLTFDFTGTSEQAPGFINSGRAGSVGGVLTALFPIMAYDIPWNDGLMRPIKIIIPRGSLCDPIPPAPLGLGPTAASWVLQNASIVALSRLVGCSEKHKRESQGVTMGAFNALNLRGLNQFGEPFGHYVIDVMGGGGAYSFRDGLDPAKGYGIAVPNVANVEWNENYSPILYKYRGLITDSGGPGKYRGGCAAGMAFIPYDTKGLDAVLVSHGVEVPNSSGVFGAFPGSCQVNTLIKEDSGKPGQWERRQPFSHGIGGRNVDLGSKPGRFAFGIGDVFEYTWQGGGGYGDPLDREPERVAKDVVNGLVSGRYAEEIYGVVVDEVKMAVNYPETDKRRRAIREERLAGMPEELKNKTVLTGGEVVQRLGEWLEIVKKGNSKYIRCSCGHVLSNAGENWKPGAYARLIDSQIAGPLVKLHKDLEMREYMCPDCARLHSVEVAVRGEAPLWEIDIKA